MKNKLLYLLLCILTIYVGILYYSKALLGLAVVEVCLPVISFLLLKLSVWNMSVRPYLPIGVADKNQFVNTGIEIESKNIIPLFDIMVKIRIKNKFYDKEQFAQIWGMAEGKKKTKLTKKISLPQCGPILIEIQELYVFDLFRLFSKKISVHETETLAVLPEYYCASMVLPESVRDFIVESEDYDKNRPGDDPSEVFQIREYRGGDRMQSIHWKLSARSDDLMVKEYSLPIGNAVVVFWDMFYEPDKIYGYLDEWIEAGLAISQGLLEAGCEHYAVWFNRIRQDIERIELKEIEDLYLLTDRIFATGPYTENVLLEELYKEKFRGETWHTQLLLNLKKELWKNGELYMELSGCARELLENEMIL